MWAPSARAVTVRVNGRDHAARRRRAARSRGRGCARRRLRLRRRRHPAGRSVLALPAGGRARPVAGRRHRGVRRRAARRRRSRSSSSTSSTSGTFSAEGTFDGAIPHLRDLAELGVTAIELMPVATFPGDRNWGYDGLYTWAPHPVYGGPEGLARLVAAAHEVGLGVILDVVYNHVGPGSEALAAFGPYFTDRHETFWGAAIDYTRPWVREWAIQNAELWIRDYGIDGLRLDAVHAIFDDESDTHVLRELRDRVAAVDERALVTAEMETGDLRPIERVGPRRPVGRRAPPRAARPSHGRAGRLLRGLRLARRPRRAASAPSARAPDRLLAEPRPGRQPRLRRPARRGRAPPPGRLRPARAADAAALHGRGVRRAPPVPVLHRPRRPGRSRG